MIVRRSIGVVIDLIGEILAFATVIFILFMLIMGRFPIFPVNVMTTLRYIREVAIITVLSLKGLEFALKRGWIVTGIFILIVVAIVILTFVPGYLPKFIQNGKNLIP